MALRFLPLLSFFLHFLLLEKEEREERVEEMKEEKVLERVGKSIEERKEWVVELRGEREEGREEEEEWIVEQRVEEKEENWMEKKE